jgi:aldose 1-epimerase
MTAPALLELRADSFALALCPEVGGGVARAEGWGHELLRPAREMAVAARDPLRLASYVLVPFSNRVRDARFTFDGQTYQLARNFLPEPHAIHGNGWQRAWRVERADAAAAVLALSHDPTRDGAEAWPFAYEAEQIYRLAADGFTVALRLTNKDARRMPAGLGLHPFFPLTPATRLTAKLGGVWQSDARKLPAKHTGLPPEWDFAAGQPVAPVSVDNCFTGWEQTAEIEWPDRNLRLDLEASSNLRSLVIFVPQAHDYFCVEPVSNINDAFNLAADGVPDTGMIVLAPGETLAAEIRFRFSRISPA